MASITTGLSKLNLSTAKFITINGTKDSNLRNSPTEYRFILINIAAIVYIDSEKDYLDNKVFNIIHLIDGTCIYTQESRNSIVSLISDKSVVS